jgi:hypothetical protein
MCANGLELGAEHIDALVRSRWLADRDVHTKDEIVTGLQAWIDDTLLR